MTNKTTLEQFLTGQTLSFTSFSGKMHTARWFVPSGVPMHSLEIRNADGIRQRWFFASEHEARNFYQAATSPECGGIT